MTSRRTHCYKGHELTPDNVYVSPNGDRYCLICKRAKSKERSTHPDKPAAKHHRSSRYGITSEQYEDMVAEADGRCMLCGRPFETTPFIDHNHLTKKVRHLVCRSCNTGLGMFGDSVELLQKAIDYLKRWDGTSK